ncbi:hypothetical protein ABIB57_000043 [Devosia sp. UYZn731]|uniref:FecR family protein n=1 Tax=Devosia sp. UYZn731 TaxID=3156345 RepID=UPI003391FBFC
MRNYTGMMMKNLIFAGFAVAIGLLAMPAMAVNEGTAVGVNPDAIARINTGDRVLIAGSGISVGETLVTGPRGQVQIIFADDTHMVVGPNSALRIETYLMRNNGTAEKLAVNALAGSFRFITGRSPKPAYQINTPTAAIAVRGTEFDILVTPTDTRVMLYEGALQLCSSGADCEQVTQRCEVGLSSARQADLFTRNDPKRPPLADGFYYAHFQSPLMGEFRVNGAAQCLKNPSAPAPAESIGPTFSPEDGPATGRQTGGTNGQTGTTTTGGQTCTGPRC